MKKLLIDEDVLKVLETSLTKCLQFISIAKNVAVAKENAACRVQNEKEKNEKYLRINEVSDMLGISKRTLGRWTKSIDFRLIKTSRCYYSLSQLKKLVDTGVIMLDHQKMSHFMEKYEKILTESKKKS